MIVPLLVPPKRLPSRKSPGAFRTISEAATELRVPQHVLRFWETKFPQLRPVKRGGGRRYYRPEDLELLRRIAHMLHVEGYTIKAAQRLLSESAVRPPPEEKPFLPDAPMAVRPPQAASPEMGLAGVVVDKGLPTPSWPLDFFVSNSAPLSEKPSHSESKESPLLRRTLENLLTQLRQWRESLGCVASRHTLPPR
jgi:DNA-binding transcriptional MerR regulator